MMRATVLRAPLPFAPAQRRTSLRVRCEAAPAALASTDEAAGGAKQLRLQFGVKNIPHPAKASYGGEDAFFIIEKGGGAMGIADGVGGWQEAGVNPADYSKTFMATARQYLEECASLYPQPEQPDGGVMATGDWLASLPAEAVAPAAQQASSSDSSSRAGIGAASPAPSSAASSLASTSGEPRTAVQALDIAHKSTRLPGSSTACVLRLDAARGMLDAANLGDSGFLIIRNGQLFFQSPAMQHFFDCPLQFGMPPDTDWAADADVFSFEVQPGDAIVLATDGLLDNCHREDIVRLAPRSAQEVQQAADAMAELASRNAADPEYESPYTQEALEEGYDIPVWEKLLNARFKEGKLELGKLRGGKMDDITVLVAYVTEA